LTQNFSLIFQIRDFGSGQIRLSPRLAKIALWWLARRDYFLAKVSGLVTADGATNVYSLNRRAVTVNTGHTTKDKISQKNYHSLHYMYRLFDFLYKRILPLYIKPRFLYTTRMI
jgi:hypothetical protein